MSDSARREPPGLRERIMPWVMAAVRLGAGWLVSRADFMALIDPGSPLRAAVPAPLALVVPVLIGAGLLTFAWPRSYLAGAAALALGLGLAEWLWERIGLPHGPLPWSLGVIGVLSVGEWLTRRVQRQFNRD